MKTDTPKGDDVRSLYVAVEGLIAKYTEQFIKAIEDDVKKLESAQRPTPPSDFAGYIYIIQVADGIIKPGRSGNFGLRQRTYRTGRLEGVNVVYKFRTDNLKAVEDCMKVHLREFQYQKGRELYKVDVSLAKGIIEKCDDVSNWKTEYAYKNRHTNTESMNGGCYVLLRRAN